MLAVPAVRPECRMGTTALRPPLVDAHKPDFSVIAWYKLFLGPRLQRCRAHVFCRRVNVSFGQLERGRTHPGVWTGIFHKVRLPVLNDLRPALRWRGDREDATVFAQAGCTVDGVHGFSKNVGLARIALTNTSGGLVNISRATTR